MLLCVPHATSTWPQLPLFLAPKSLLCSVAGSRAGNEVVEISL